MNAAQLGFWAILLAGAVRLATPITFAALGETLVEGCGIVNLGIEGMMALGAFVGVWGASGQGWTAGLILGGVAGGLLALLMGFAIFKGSVNQIVAGIAVTLLGSGFANYGFEVGNRRADRPWSYRLCRHFDCRCLIDFRLSAKRCSRKVRSLILPSSPSPSQLGHCGRRRRDCGCVRLAMIRKPRSSAAWT